MSTFADVSHHQTSVDLAAYKAAGHDRIVLKATEGTGFTDPAFAGRWKRAGELGLARVAYCYGEAQDNGADDFDHLLAVVKAAGGMGSRDRLCLDVEDVDDGTKDYSRAQYHVREFTNRAQALGYPNGLIYTGRWYANPAHVDPTDMPPGWRQLWISHYDQSVPDDQILLPDGWTRGQVVARQYTYQATIAGIAGPCDNSRLLREWLATSTATPPEEDMPITADDAEKIAKAVWAEGLQGEMNAPERAGQILVHTRVWAALIRDLLPGVANRAVDAQASLSALLSNSGVVSELSDDALQAISDAVSAELASRLAAGGSV